MDLSILELLYIVLIFFIVIIGTLLSIVLYKIINILKTLEELITIYNKIKQILVIYSSIPDLILNYIKEKIFGDK